MKKGKEWRNRNIIHNNNNNSNYQGEHKRSSIEEKKYTTLFSNYTARASIDINKNSRKLSNEMNRQNQKNTA